MPCLLSWISSFDNWKIIKKKEKNHEWSWSKCKVSMSLLDRLQVFFFSRVDSDKNCSGRRLEGIKSAEMYKCSRMKLTQRWLSPNRNFPSTILFSPFPGDRFRAA